MAEGVLLLEGSAELGEAKADQAGLQFALGDKSRAERLCREAMPMIESFRGRNLPSVRTRAYTCAGILLESKPKDAERQLLKLLDAGTFKLDVERAIILAQIAKARLRMKRLGETVAAIDEAVALARSARDVPLLRPMLYIRANVLRAMKRRPEAAECEREAAALFVPPGNTVVDARLLRIDAKPRTSGLSR
ncbi:MAG: hypothetical protein FJW38_09170 [Acidobacteria bacterium]|nr:hypothetical protein [Acidobacteriota bacterium]